MREARDGFAIGGDAVLGTARGFQLGGIVEPDAWAAGVVAQELLVKGDGLAVVPGAGEGDRLQAQAFEARGIVREQALDLGERAMRLVQLEQHRRVAIARGDELRRDAQAFLEQPLGIGEIVEADRQIGEQLEGVGIARMGLEELPKPRLGFLLAPFAQRERRRLELGLGRQRALVGGHFGALSWSG